MKYANHTDNNLISIKQESQTLDEELESKPVATTKTIETTTTLATTPVKVTTTQPKTENNYAAELINPDNYFFICHARFKNICNYGGTCLHRDNTVLCICKTGYSGFFCDTKI
jgi:hypothetical protein